jgi:hypothetical protein
MLVCRTTNVRDQLARHKHVLVIRPHTARVAEAVTANRPNPLGQGFWRAELEASPLVLAEG